MQMSFDSCLISIPNYFSFPHGRINMFITLAISTTVWCPSLVIFPKNLKIDPGLYTCMFCVDMTEYIKKKNLGLEVCLKP
jgi:hypothetical protein